MTATLVRPRKTSDRKRPDQEWKQPYVFVSPEEFRELLVSRQKLVRVDESGLRGLFAPETGVRYVVREDEL